MSNYKLYGEIMIEDDSTLESFAMSIIKKIPEDDLEDAKGRFINNPDDGEYKQEFMTRVRGMLSQDISRTDIDYPALMKKYSTEIGNILFDMDNSGYDLSAIELSFFGDKARRCFNIIVAQKVWTLKCSQCLHELSEDEFREEIRKYMREILVGSVSCEYVGYIMQEIEDDVITDITECASFQEDGSYTDDDVRLAIGRVLASRLDVI